jgi:hypothetical protein
MRRRINLLKRHYWISIAVMALLFLLALVRATLADPLVQTTVTVEMYAIAITLWPFRRLNCLRKDRKVSQGVAGDDREKLPNAWLRDLCRESGCGRQHIALWLVTGTKLYVAGPGLLYRLHVLPTISPGAGVCCPGKGGGTMSGYFVRDALLLRPLEPEDLDQLYRWENDTRLWENGSTVTPFSKFALGNIAGCRQIFKVRQLRMMIVDKEAIGRPGQSTCTISTA